MTPKLWIFLRSIYFTTLDGTSFGFCSLVLDLITLLVSGSWEGGWTERSEFDDGNNGKGYIVGGYFEGTEDCAIFGTYFAENAMDCELYIPLLRLGLSLSIIFFCSFQLSLASSTISLNQRSIFPWWKSVNASSSRFVSKRISSLDMQRVTSWYLVDIFRYFFCTFMQWAPSCW